MIKVDVVNTLGKKVGDVEVSENVFGQEYNEALIHQVIVAQLANKRQGTKSALTRTEVRGGGRKPWRQKGTGRARQGSIRAPQWIKGGVVFAPKPRDFSKKVNKQMKELALCSALSAKLKANEIVVLDGIKVTAPKTKQIASVQKSLGLDKKTFIVTKEADANLVLACRNIPAVTLADVALINVYDIVRNDKLVITKDAITALQEVYA